ncbi:MAG TPA: MFS transporter [Rhodopila sp.]|uniref:MFS transporter n=1 Tax=Rhodopila sp. TaxID=2480087 RepID=UPI002CEAD309|nr:MFS transporter [Rhodopila sp.]HVY15080.1 MFS transporter [Rhodopila sp.]
MISARIAKLCSGRLHYAWIALAVMFCGMLAGVAVRAAPGVMIVPLQRAFGWDVSTISGAVSLNIILMGATGPFITGLIQVIGLKRTVVGCLTLLMTGTGLSYFMTAPWQMFLTWGLMVGIGSSAGAVGIAGAVANRWFVQRTGLAVGLLTSANAAGQLIFLPLMAYAAEAYGWRGVAVGVTAAIAIAIPLVAILLPESPAAVGLPAFGTTEIVPDAVHSGHNPFGVAFIALGKASKSPDFWLLCLTFGVCGFSTNGLINTHLIAYCADHGIPEMQGASILAVIGIFSLIGSTMSGYLCDRFNPRVLLFWYYGLRGLSLVLMPFSDFGGLSLGVFSIFYGLDWVATGPATFALTNEVFGRRDAPVIVAWIFAAHQIGGSAAALGAGAVRSLSGSYLLAFLASGLACLMASMLVLRVSPRSALVPAAE